MMLQALADVVLFDAVAGLGGQSDCQSKAERCPDELARGEETECSDRAVQNGQFLSSTKLGQNRQIKAR
jgi:hypothetical protein